MPRVYRMLLISFITFQVGVCASFSDTVIMKNRERIKGVVVEDYGDRIVLSTMDGEKQLLKKDIKRIIYDLEEQNLTSLADFYLDRGMYQTAYYYYEEALKINPEYKKAKEGISYAETYVKQTDRVRKLDHIQKLKETKQWQKGITDTDKKSEEDELRDMFGISLKNVDGSYTIVDVLPGSSSAKSGLKKGDIILSTWGRTISYMQPDEVMKRLLSAETMEVRLSIARTMMLELKNVSGNYTGLTGIKLGFSEMEGMVVEDVTKGSIAARAGIRKDDVLVGVQGESTRYMSLKEVENIIKSRKDETISLEIERDVVIWKKFEKPESNRGGDKWQRSK